MPRVRSRKGVAKPRTARKKRARRISRSGWGPRPSAQLPPDPDDYGDVFEDTFHSDEEDGELDEDAPGFSDEGDGTPSRTQPRQLSRSSTRQWRWPEHSRGRSLSRSRRRHELDAVSEIVRVPHDMLGLIIGRGGSVVKQVEDDSGARISVNNDSAEVRISGSARCVAWAKERVTKLVEDELWKRSRSRSRRRREIAAVSEIVRVPQDMLGLIIGRGGSVVTQIEGDTGARIAVNNESAEVRISGGAKRVAWAKEMVTKLVQDELWKRSRSRSRRRRETADFSEIVPVPHDMLGLIIGRGGTCVKQMEDDSGARISVNNESAEVRISGSARCVAWAKERVTKLVEDELCKRSRSRSRRRRETVAVDDLWKRSRSRSRRRRETDAVSEIVPVPHDMLGLIIGRGGSVVMRIEDDSGARIAVNNESAEVRISGSARCVACATEMVTKLVEDESRKGRETAAASEIVPVPHNMLGRIIGRGGSVVKQIQEDSGARVAVNNESAEVRISGSPRCVACAKEMVTKLVEDVQKVREGMLERTMDVPEELHGKLYGKRGQTIMKLQEESGAKINIYPESCNVCIKGSAECITRAENLISELLTRTSDEKKKECKEPAVVTETVQVPQEWFGRIIGRGGSCVMQIQEDSGARIDVNKGYHSSEVRISGSAGCVAQAKEMMTKLVEDVQKEKEGTTMDVPEELLGRIYGKRGQTIKQLQDESGAKISICPDSCNVCIKGSAECITCAENLISELLTRAPDEMLEDPPEEAVEETIEVPRKDVGRVIGKGGQNVKKLEDDSGANIQVDHLFDPPCVRIRGSADVVARAIDMVSELIYGDGSGFIIYGDGSASAGAGDGEIEETMEFLPEQAGKIIGPHGSTINGIRDQSGASIAIKNESTCCRLRISGDPDQVLLAMDMIKALGEGGGVEKTVELPLELAGRIIGKQGATIKEIRRSSGANIVVKKVLTCCKVVLSGTDEQVLQAQNMIRAIHATHVPDTQDSSMITALGEGSGVEKTMELPLEVAGRIIGKQGATIEELKRNSGAHIVVNKEPTCCKIALAGTDEQVLRAENMIRAVQAKHVPDTQDNSMFRLLSSMMEALGEGDGVEKTMELPLKLAGRIIGKKRATIEELKRNSGAHIVVHTEPTCCKISLAGTEEQVLRAENMIRAVHAKHVLDTQDGGMINALGEGGGVEKTMELPLEVADQIIGRQGATIEELIRSSGAHIVVNKEPTCCKIALAGTDEQVLRAENMICAVQAEHVPDTQDSSMFKLLNSMMEALGKGGGAEKTMELPLEVAGRIIGKQGATIEQVRRNSGAHIVVNKELTCCRFALSGTDEQVLRAQNMIRAVYAKHVLETKGSSIARGATFTENQNGVIRDNAFRPATLHPRVRPQVRPTRAPDLHLEDDSQGEPFE